MRSNSFVNIRSRDDATTTSPGDARRAEGLKQIIQGILVVNKTKYDNAVHQVADRLFVGSIGAALSKDRLHAAGITHIVSATPSVPVAFPGDFVYHSVELLDTDAADLMAVLPDAVRFIDRALRHPAHRVLVHCFAGRSRSVSIIIGYLVGTAGLDVDQALAQVRQTRPMALPNQGFMKQLRNYEKQLRRSGARPPPTSNALIRGDSASSDKPRASPPVASPPPIRQKSGVSYVNPYVPFVAPPRVPVQPMHSSADELRAALLPSSMVPHPHANITNNTNNGRMRDLQGPFQAMSLQQGGEGVGRARAASGVASTPASRPRSRGAGSTGGRLSV
ncbi:unnamed protein product [Vitrella brassicaformis CCMP3155]|uniref:Protein-tyrosine-phosphatase n=1 Tax=Vitrella brassicaformis (strain CCMP3155) TaxID=1169540 RepID=A0A0G4GC42_VITBC|nr:unnamed protein product [Vitrella brassicaformis CCMP3155]|eukprot:CEM26416.1 unnamed protein product [Vitrella brassicaformis CCMP3155]